MSRMNAFVFDIQEDYHNQVPFKTSVENLMYRYDLLEDYASNTVRQVWNDIERELFSTGHEPY